MYSMKAFRGFLICVRFLSSLSRSRAALRLATEVVVVITDDGEMSTEHVLSECGEKLPEVDPGERRPPGPHLDKGLKNGKKFILLLMLDQLSFSNSIHLPMVQIVTLTYKKCAHNFKWWKKFLCSDRVLSTEREVSFLRRVPLLKSYLKEWNNMSEEANKDCCRCLQDAKVAAIKAELAAAAAKADDVLIVFDTKIIIQDNIRKTHTPCKNTVCTLHRYSKSTNIHILFT